MSYQCRRCQGAPATEGDTYCLCCSAWEALGRELQAPWSVPHVRSIVTDLVVSTARAVRALRNYCLSQAKPAGGSPSGKGKGVQEKAEEAEDTRGELPRKRPHRQRESSGVSLKEVKREEAKRRRPASTDSSEEAEDEDEEPEGTDPYHRPLGGEDRRDPPGPEGPPPSSDKKKEHPWRSQHSSPAGKHRAAEDHRRERDRGRRKRAGRKHQRLYRLEKNPTLRVHRSLPGLYLDRRAEDIGLQALETL